jgi:uncharacterized OB-fold protein
MSIRTDRTPTRTYASVSRALAEGALYWVECDSCGAATEPVSEHPYARQSAARKAGWVPGSDLPDKPLGYGTFCPECVATTKRED